jgi:hypothetical protein
MEMMQEQRAEAIAAMAGLTVGGLEAEAIWRCSEGVAVADLWRRTQAWVRFATWATATGATLTYDLLLSYRRHVLDATMMPKAAGVVVSWLRTFLRACPDVPEEAWRSKLGRGRKADTEPKRDFLLALFGLQLGFSQDDLRKGFRRALRVIHPDDPTWEDLVKAYEWLSYGVGELCYEQFVRCGGNDEIEQTLKELFVRVGGYAAVQRIKNYSF